MPVKPSELCPCGSGKKNRFCCFPLAARFQETDELVKENLFKEALAKLEEANQAYPHSLEVLAYQYLVLEMMGNSTQAGNLLEQVLNQHPRYAWGLHLQGMRLLGQEKHMEAIECLQQALLFYPPNAEERIAVTLSALGKGYYALGNYPTAKKTWQLGLKMDASQEKLMYSLLYLIYENRDLPVEARVKDDFYHHFFTQGQPAVMASIATLHADAFAAFDQHEYAEAAALCQEILGIDIAYKTAWYLLGSIAIKQQNQDLALLYFRHYTTLEEDQALANKINLLLDDLEHTGALDEGNFFDGDSFEANFEEDLAFEPDAPEEEPYLIYELVYSIRKVRPLLVELRQKAFLVEEEWIEENEATGEKEVRFTWWEEPTSLEENPVLIGSIIITGEQLTLICASRQRIQEGQETLEKEVGFWLDRNPELRGGLIRGDEYLALDPSDPESLDLDELEDFIRLSRIKR